MTRISVLGAGSWGTALSILASDAGQDVTLWARSPALSAAIERTGANPEYLPELRFPDGFSATSDLQKALSGAERVILCIPSHGIRDVLKQAQEFLEQGAILISAAKGIEIGTRMRISEVAFDVLSRLKPSEFACLSGPSFALEAALRHPTAVAISSESIQTARLVQSELSTSSFRLYANSDLIGTELAGAAKNVMAIAAGMLAGLGFGTNSQAALLTRGVAEISRFCISFGAAPETMMGLAGLGDLILTCTGELSRNRFVGEQLGKGRGIDAIAEGLNEVAEGIKTAISVKEMADARGIDMPITEAVYSVMYGGVEPISAVEALMLRPLKDE